MRDDSDESARVHREPQMSDALSHILVALDNGDTTEAIRLFDEACNERFEAGIEYGRDTVDEWYGR
jgi:hypothetical protein